ncbi:hypothetical protein BJ138DRAFT_1159376 [Hygrophoropsis aurantiaca]|uniref:Uncharacterized protein n=1 Tax=Hygrophoropsis aurantiaca TaxID=72124 RepID=A0ACB8A512_9AGAM|nr:hypothetical protein BJ138DRAFT_1159376 [Hygrophoropsis aurantiaca]
MQAILVVRVYALFNQSKKVLFFLITSYVLQATATFVVLGLILNKRVLDEYYVSLGPAIGSVTQPLTENPSAFPKSLNQDSTILLMVFDAILLLFALWAFVKHILEAKTLNGGWSINVLVRILVADHLLYFVCNLIWLSLSVASNYAETTNYIGILYPVFDALVVVFGPRMVISLRTTENKTRGEGGTLEGEVSTIQFGIREQPESAVEEGGGFRAADESLNVQMD